jgi:hypothetical protein
VASVVLPTPPLILKTAITAIVRPYVFPGG